jgi:hypothetical protein
VLAPRENAWQEVASATCATPSRPQRADHQGDLHPEERLGADPELLAIVGSWLQHPAMRMFFHAPGIQRRPADAAPAAMNARPGGAKARC